ncbi:hypothetical protein AMTRI_Chr05g74100 [Amborella trichopoda]
MTTEELNERRRKGLCFRCNEKFGSGHRCKKLFMIQVTLEENEEIPEISLHGIAGIRAPETMRVKGSLQHKAVTVLIDSGSTHNFVSETLAISGGRLEVMWLSTLGRIVWDFSKLQMKFSVAGKEGILQGLSIPEKKVVSNLQLQNAAPKAKGGILLHLFSMRATQTQLARPTYTSVATS